MSSPLDKIKKQILEALSHPEAEEGLYFRNFCHLHEEDERPAVVGEEIQVLDALKELISAGLVVLEDEGKESIFRKAVNS